MFAILQFRDDTSNRSDDGAQARIDNSRRASGPPTEYPYSWAVAALRDRDAIYGDCSDETVTRGDREGGRAVNIAPVQDDGRLHPSAHTQDGHPGGHLESVKPCAESVCGATDRIHSAASASIRDVFNKTHLRRTIVRYVFHLYQEISRTHSLLGNERHAPTRAARALEDKAA